MEKIELGVVPEKTYRIVSDPAVARRLLKGGYCIVDIKAKKQFPKETVFVFEVKEGFVEKFEQYSAERKSQKSTD